MEDGFAIPPEEELRTTLCSMEQPIAKRMRALFCLRTLNTDSAVEAIGQGKWASTDVKRK